VEQQRFDELTKKLATGRVSRGRVLAALAAGLGLSMMGGRSAIADTCKGAGATCKADTDCCNGTCASGRCAAWTVVPCRGNGVTVCRGACVSTACCHAQAFNPRTCRCEAICAANGGTCKKRADCCSGTCAHGACAQTCDPALIPPPQRPFCNAAFTCVCASTTDGDLCIGIPSGAPGCLGGPQGCPAGTVCMAISGADGSPGLTVHCLQACTADTNCPSGQVCLTRGGTSGGCAAICS